MKQYQYKIIGKYVEDITEEFIDGLLEPFYIYKKQNGKIVSGRLTESIRIIERKVYYIVADESIHKEIDKRINQTTLDRYGIIECEKTEIDESFIIK